ncbi:SDR family NAD(P)-dependent oxidoreductase [Sphingobium fuliginis]|uniref:SDR family NAD(P)-dependent oxidoreductase n=1 Tax=Sphingobium fuliginis (strain ATCC 27551) TaxID=336203 RepID=UPI00143042C0|nr:SDR family oxidoreductase [Sphingobium fuliginis]
MNINGKKILVVGGGAGIGAGIAYEAAMQGAEVAIADLSATALDEIGGRIRAAGKTVHTCPVDIGSDESVAAMGQWCEREMGAPDLLLVTVIEYLSSFSGLDDMDIAGWKRSFEVNFFGYIRVLEHVLPAMRARGTGTVALTASTVALLPDPTAAVLMRYKSIKHAMLGFSQALAIALEGSGLRSVCFCPSLTATPGAIDNLRSSGLPGVESILDIAATVEDVARYFLSELEKEEFLICAHAGYREQLVELASEQLDPAPFIARHFPSSPSQA